MNTHNICSLFIIACTALAPGFSAHADLTVPNTAEEATPLQAGQSIPDVVLRSPQGKPVELREIVGKTDTLLIFYRGGWCPYCNKHLAELVDIEEEMKAMGYQVIAVSPDRPEILAEAGDTPGYQLYSDSSMQAAKAFGIAFRVDDKTVERYHKYNIDLEAASGESHQLLPVPSVFIIDKSGTIQFQYHNADYRKRLSANKILKAARDLRAKPE